jgi:amino acid adenylation domain-containing protein
MMQDKVDNLFIKLRSLGIKLALDEKGSLLVRGRKNNLDSTLIQNIKALKDDIVASLKVSNSKIVTKPILPCLRKTSLPLSYAQQRLWMLDKIDGGSAHYHIPVALELNGELNQTVFEASFRQIIMRHESLRTVFREQEGEPVQVITSADQFSVQLEDLTALDNELCTEVLTSRLQAEALAPFDLSADLMLRVQLIKRAEQTYIALVTMHHIASDGWSAGILIKEFSELYSAGVAGRQSQLPELSVQYADYAHWQRNWLQGEVLDKQLGYWEKQLANIPVVHSLPLDKARPKEQTFAGRVHTANVSPAIHQTLEQQCKAVGATLFMGLHAAFSVLLSRYSNETDIVVGSPIANREQAEVAGLIGFFVNTLVLRSDLSGAPSFTDLLTQSKEMLLDAYAYQQVPFEQIVERLQPQRSLSHSPLFQVILVLQNNEQSELTLPGLSLSTMINEEVTAKYDVTLNVQEGTDGLSLQWEYNCNLFKDETIERMSAHFVQLLEELIAQPQENVFKLPMLSQSERVDQLDTLKDTLVKYPQDKCIHELFEAQVAAQPDEVVLVFEEQCLTYAQLNGKANQLAQYLIAEKGIKPDSLVGICVERSLDMLVGILGILKAGGAYVPLDPNYPAARLTYMLEDAQLDTVISHGDVVERTPISQDQAVCLDNELLLERLTEYPQENLIVSQLGLAPSNLAYVIYTSGSTGNPKGVLVEHCNVTRLFDSSEAQFNFDCQDVWTMFHSFSFDFTVWEIWGALIKGGKLVIVPFWVSRSPSDFYQLLIDQKVTVLNQTPSAFNALIQEDNKREETLSLRYVIFGGEALSLKSLRPWVAKHGDSKPALINMYGITETTVHVTYRKVTAADINTQLLSSNIGQPLSDLGIVLLNQEQTLVADGIIGEMYVCGDGVTRGYLNREELTADRFVTLKEFGNERFYRTGDLARRTKGAELEYLGRIDHQIKIRGFRVELGEIENAIVQEETVREAVVVTHEEKGNAIQLVAYVVALAPVDVLQYAEYIDMLRHKLSQNLPEHMLPTFFVLMDNLPLTTNGKVDKKALPAPDVTLSKKKYIAPVTASEVLLCKIWQETLEIEQVGTDDNFFALGGHSLMVINIISCLQKEDISIEARDIFATATLAELAQVIDLIPAGGLELFQVPDNLIPQDCEQISPEMLPLIDLTDHELAVISAQIPNGVSNIKDIYPLGPLQEGIFYHHLIHNEGDPYVIPSLYKMADKQAVLDFLSALQFVIDRHDVLRTAIISQNLPRAVQVVLRQAQLNANWLNEELESDVEQTMHQLMDPSVQQMNLTLAPLMSVKVMPTKDSNAHYVLLQYHHIISDHIGLELIHQELALYQFEKQDTLAPAVPYREFIAHTQHVANERDPETFFSGYLADITEPTLPFNLLDTSTKMGSIEEKRLILNSDISNELRQVARKVKVSPAVIFHAVWALVVASCSGKDDVVFGTVVSGRLQGATNVDSMLGVLINTLPLRTKIGDYGLMELLSNIHQTLQTMLAYEQTPLALAQTCSGLDVGVPLFSAMLNFRHSRMEESESELSAKGRFEFIAGQERTNYPFNLTVDDFGHQFELEVQIDDSIGANRILDYVNNTLHTIVEKLKQEENCLAKDIEVMSKLELAQQLLEWNGDSVNYPQEKSINLVFEEQAEQFADNTALIFQGESLTYAQLNKRANRLARYLIAEKGVCHESMVGICIERSMDLVVAILAILKAGGAYVPLDPNYPSTRIDYMLKDTNLQLILTHTELSSTIASSKSAIVCLNEQNVIDEIVKYVGDNIKSQDVAPSCLCSGSSLAYVNYTSGSTGEPKGVLVEHHNVTSLVINNDFVTFNEDTRMLQAATISFDAATCELWGPLLNGGVLVLYTSGSLDTNGIGEHINENNINTCWMTAGLFDQFTHLYEGELASLRYLIVGGDVVNPATVAVFYRTYPQVTLINGYGPTENTTFSNTYTIPTDFDISKAIPIGRPLANRSAYVFNNNMRPIATGTIGELYVGGEGLSRGYLNRDDLTNENFVTNPYFNCEISDSSERLYRTGDMVRWLPDGDIEYIGRIDNQVKIRGFRIELGEIEAKLVQLEQIKEAVIDVVESNAGGKQLIAYLVVNQKLQDSEQEASLDEIKSQLSQFFPDYMVPTRFICLEKLPLTVNGKVDKRALPSPGLNPQQEEYVAPQGEVEVILSQIWQQVLGLVRVSATDNFFSLGGHSLLAMKLQAQVQQQFDIKLQIKDLLHCAQLKDMATKIDELCVNKKNVELRATVKQEEEIVW